MNDNFFSETIDYRVVKFQKLHSNFEEFNEKLKRRFELGINNEFETRPLDIKSFENENGFIPISLVVIFVPYATEEKLKKSKDANISIHGVSLDYHTEVKKLLSQIIQKIENANPGSKFYTQCDNGVFNERFFALNTGLGKMGRNQMVINEKFGSYGFLGLIATNAQLEEYTTKVKKCINCGLCKKICPSGAIGHDFFDSNICLSYLTQKKNLSPKEEELLKKNRLVYGCDCCQIVCSENNNKKYSNIEDFNRDLLYNIVLEDIINLTNKEFKNKYSNRNFSWRGKKTIVRNLTLNKL